MEAMNADEMLAAAERIIEESHLLEVAAQILRWAVEVDANDEVRRRLAEVLVKIGKADEARAVLAELGDSNDPVTLNVRALARADAFDYDAAIALLDRALQVAPKE